MAVSEVFRALGDPVRLEMLQRLSRGAPSTVSNLTAGLGITRQGARKHLQTLADAGLVSLEPKGREVLVELEADALSNLQNFISALEQQWDARLEGLKRFTELK